MIERNSVTSPVTKKQRSNVRQNSFVVRKDTPKNTSKEQVEDLRATFSMFDTDGSGSISREELLIVLRRFGQNIESLNLSNIMNEIDSNNDGVVDFNEFLTILEKSKIGGDDECELQTAFDMIDTNNDGFISGLELKTLLEKVNYSMTDDEIVAIMDECDINRDGLLDYSEFHKLMSF